MTNRPRVSVPLTAFVLILSITGGCSTAKPTQANAKGASPKEAAVPVHVFSVASREIRRIVDAVGTLFPYDEVVVSAEVDGRAEKVLVDVGDQVAKGQTLVEILPTEFKLAADQQEAMLEQVRAKLGFATGEHTNILAPFGGYVKERDVTVGQYLKVQTPVMTIVNVDPIRVRLKVPEKMAAWVPVGQLVTLSVEAYPDRTFSGKIWRINPSVDPQTRTFDAEVLTENHQGVLKPGFFVKASIPSTKVDQVLFVPQKALSYAYGIYKVYTLTKENRLKESEVKLGDRLGEDVELIDGVRAGDRLALPVEGQELAVKDGAPVKIVDAAAKTGSRRGPQSSGE